MKNAIGFTKERDIEPWPSDFELASELDGFDEWKERLEDLHVYMELEVDPGLRFYFLQYPDFEGDPFLSGDDKITVLNPHIVSVLSFRKRELGIYIAHGYQNAFFSALRHSAVFFLYTKYGLEFGYESPLEVPNIGNKMIAAQSFLVDQIDVPVSREEIIDDTNADYTSVDMNEKLPWSPDNTGSEKPLYQTEWTKKEVYEARKTVKEIQKEEEC